MAKSKKQSKLPFKNKKKRKADSGKDYPSKKQKKSKSKKKYKFKKPKRSGNKQINVAENKDVQTTSYYKQKVTNKQQKLINKRFQNGYSPFKDCYTFGFQETVKYGTSKCKWIWRCYNNLEYLMKAFAYFPEFSTTTGTSSMWNKADAYQNSPDQTVFYNQFKYSYEIYNPTNYDMNLVIYDIVCKQDTTNACTNVNYNIKEDPSNSAGRDPVRLIELGLNSVSGIYTIDPQQTSGTIVSDSTAKTLHDISLKPTESYPFNIYYTIVKKHYYKLQPGAILHHKFVHKPKALVNRGYLGYRYGKDMKRNDGDAQRGIKDITSGCLFKFWGQVSGTSTTSTNAQTGNTEGNHDKVTTLSGAITFKEEYMAKWDCMDEKYTYTFNNTSLWRPNEDDNMDEEDLQVIGVAHPMKVADADFFEDEAVPDD